MDLIIKIYLTMCIVGFFGLSIWAIWITRFYETSWRRKEKRRDKDERGKCYKNYTHTIASYDTITHRSFN